MSLSSLSTTFSATSGLTFQILRPSQIVSGLILAHASNENWSIGINWIGGAKWIRTKGGSSSATTSGGTVTTSGASSSQTSSFITITSSVSNPYLNGTYDLSSNLTGLGTLLIIFCGNTDNQAFNLSSSSFITLKLPQKLFMQVSGVYQAIDPAQNGRGTYMLEGSNNNGVNWTKLFDELNPPPLGGTNNDTVTSTPLTTQAKNTPYNMFRWTFQMTTQITAFRNVDLVGKFYYDAS